MPVLILSHPDCARHAPPPGHPERPDRLAAALSLVGHLDREACPEAGDDDLATVHSRAYLARLRAAEPADGARPLDADTWLSPGSLRAARLAAGGALRAVDLAVEGRRAFVATRPPGHHALAAAPMGFCLFGHVALAARRGVDHHGAGRVAIVDFDVHHGNGTQALVEDDARVLFCSTHQAPFWPGTGEQGDRGPHGTVVNVPLRAGTTGPAFRATFARAVLPRVRDHAPDLLLISAGFDADARDPLGGLALGPADLAWATTALCDVMEPLGGRVASVLEGGYDLGALAEGVAAHVAALDGGGP